MIKGFKEFIMRGNLIEVAVAFVIGLAFAAVVNATVGLIMDLIGKIGGTPDFSGYAPGGIHVGVWISAMISFVVVAAVVYFLIVTPYNKLQQRMAVGKEAAPPSPDIALLTEIRDLLAGRPGTSNVQGGGGLS